MEQGEATIDTSLPSHYPASDAALCRMMFALLASRSPSSGDDTLFVVGPAMYLFACGNSRVVAPFDTPIYGCPVCLFATADWTEFNHHRTTNGHAIAQCTNCLGISGHVDRNCLSGFTGGFWSQRDFLIPSAELTHPCVTQWHCAICRVYFENRHASQVHNARLHDTTRVNRPLRALPRRFFTRSDSDMSSLAYLRNNGAVALPSHEKKIGRLLYQCPDCHYIFSSWSQWEVHVRATKHSQPYCLECGKMLGKFVTEDGDHTMQTGHSRVIGTQPSKETYLRLVDTSAPRLVDQVDHHKSHWVDSDNNFITIYQCPVDDCGKAFLEKRKFTQHLSSTGHGSVRCDLCTQVLSVRDTSIADHPHAIPNLPPCMWHLRFPGESCSVEITEAALCEFYPEAYARCPQCKAAVEVADLEGHIGSDPCVATRGRRGAQQEQMDRMKYRREGSHDKFHHVGMLGTPPGSGHENVHSGSGHPATAPVLPNFQQWGGAGYMSGHQHHHHHHQHHQLQPHNHFAALSPHAPTFQPQPHHHQHHLPQSIQGSQPGQQAPGAHTSLPMFMVPAHQQQQQQQQPIYTPHPGVYHYGAAPGSGNSQ